MPDDPPNPGEPPHGDPRLDWDPHPRPFNQGRVDPDAGKLRQDPGAPYGRGPDGAPYTEQEYAERFHKMDPGDPIAWPPNNGAVSGTKLDYGDASKFVRDFGDKMDRLGVPTGQFMALMENGISASYEERAIHYKSLYDKLQTYTLIPGNLPKGWKIRVMETAPAMGQPGGSLGLIFFDEVGKPVSVTDLTDPRKVEDPADPRYGVLRRDR